MGETHHRYTGILLLVFSVLVLLGAIFFTVAQSKVKTIDEYKVGNAKLNTAKNNLLVAYLMAYIAAGIGMILALLYFAHVAWGISNEIPHLIVFILLFGLVVVSGIFGFLALSNIDSSGAKDKQGSTGWIWTSLVSILIGLIVLIISGAWRAQYKATSSPTANVKPSGLGTVTTNQTATFTEPSEVNYEGGAPNYPAPGLPDNSGLPGSPVQSYTSQTIDY